MNNLMNPAALAAFPAGSTVKFSVEVTLPANHVPPAVPVTDSGIPLIIDDSVPMAPAPSYAEALALKEQSLIAQRATPFNEDLPEPEMVREEVPVVTEAATDGEPQVKPSLSTRFLPALIGTTIFLVMMNMAIPVLFPA